MNEIQNQLHTIAENSTKIVDLVGRPEHFWNTQWFSAVIGAITALLVTWLKDAYSKRKKKIYSIYDFICQNTTFCSPDSLLGTAGMMQYGCTQTIDGITTIIPEKTISEKMMIELRKKCKYWQLPLSKIRFLFHKYEQLLRKIPDGDRRSIKGSNEYKQIEEIFEKIVKLSQAKTGESEWTAR